MPITSKSHVSSQGHVYFKYTGRYNEVTTEAVNNVNNDSADSSKQYKLAKKGKNSAAAKTTSNVLKELGW